MKRHLPFRAALCALLGTFSLAAGRTASAQSVLFDFDNAPLRSSLPIDLSVGGINAHLSATGYGYSIQDTTAPVVPIGFTGRFVYPNSIYKADLMVSFSPSLTQFSIQYSPQELGCDDSATMRVTAYMGSTFVGTQTTTASQPGTWPVETLSCTFPQGFDNVVVHYEKPPPTCQDYGVIFLADNMIVTPLLTTWTDLGHGLAGTSGIPNLIGMGTLAPGSAGAMELTSARPLAPVLLVLSFSNSPVPFRGGTLVPNPIAFHYHLVTDAGGMAVLPYTTPFGMSSGTHLYLQALVLDPMAVRGVALSQAVQGLTP